MEDIALSNFLQTRNCYKEPQEQHETVLIVNLKSYDHFGVLVTVAAKKLR